MLFRSCIMNLTIISQLFYPELVSTGLTLTELCEALVKKGFKLNVIAGYPTVIDPKSPIPKKNLNGSEGKFTCFVNNEINVVLV